MGIGIISHAKKNIHVSISTEVIKGARREWYKLVTCLFIVQTNSQVIKLTFVKFSEGITH